jgi:hypothetical protein
LAGDYNTTGGRLSRTSIRKAPSASDACFRQLVGIFANSSRLARQASDYLLIGRRYDFHTCCSRNKEIHH